jgi:phenylalanyl-tRNA synthetase beta chain
LQHGLRTDSAIRFEKGADISNVNYALHRAAQLIQEIAGGKVSSVFYDLFPTQTQRKKIQLSVERITNLAGKNYSVTQIKNILENLGFEIQDDRGSDFEVLVPFSKTDISMQADVVEEIMRIDGLDNIPFTGKISYSLPAVANAYKPNYKESISNQLVSKGFFEIFTNSITNANFYPDRDNLVKMMNSLSAHLDVMRASMLETGLEAVAYNLNRKNTQLKFYEFGKVYSQENNSFIENEKLAIYVSGNYRTQHYTEKEKQIDVYYVRGIIESLFKHIQLTYEAADFGLNVLLHQKKIGSIEVVSQEKLKTFDIKHAVLFAEIDWDSVKLALEKYKVVFAEIPKFPVVQRDLAIVVDKQLKYQDIQLAVKQAKCKLLQDVSLFDVFESEKLGEDKVSYALNFSFYDKQKTLTDIEVENEMKALINSLSQKVNATIRN